MWNNVLEMKRVFTATALVLAIVTSCANHTEKKTARSVLRDTVMTVPGLAVIDSLREGAPFRLCEQTLTSWAGMSAAFPDSCENYDLEMTPVRCSFLFPEPDIRPSETVSNIRTRYNMACVANRVLHAYEWYSRVVTSEADSLTARQDTLDWIAHSQPLIPDALLDEVLPSDARGKAGAFLNAYRRFDGDDGENSPFSQAFQQYANAINKYPQAATKEMLDSLKSVFWDWYDKAQFVTGIDDIIRMHLKNAPKYEISEERLTHFRNAVMSETDIDRRAILALEYAKFDECHGVEMLGEIMESGQYTRYLLEIWMSWRARVQMCHALSSYSVIPNVYYDRLRAKCINSLLRHYQETSDWTDLCFLDNFIYVEILHRQGSIYGNESLVAVASLSYDMFIHPRITGKDPFND